MSWPLCWPQCPVLGPSIERLRTNRVDRYVQNRLKKASLYDLTLMVIDCYPNSSKRRRLHVTYTASHRFKKETHRMVILGRSLVPKPIRVNRLGQIAISQLADGPYSLSHDFLSINAHTLADLSGNSSLGPLI